MEEESWERNQGRGIIEEESSKGIMKRNHGRGIMEEESRERNQASGRHLEASSEGIRRHLGHLGGIWEASGKHLGSI